jgi:hypothetical protein
MPAQDIYHDAVVHALTADGWMITHDPLLLSYGGRDLYIDLGAERTTIAAERDGQKIAIEIKSFLGSSPVRDLEEAVGQYQVCRSVLTEIDPGCVLYLAVPQRVYESLFAERFGQLIRQRLQLRLMVFDEHEERIVAWIP